VPPLCSSDAVRRLFNPTYNRLGRAAAALCGFVGSHLVFVQTGALTRQLYLPTPAEPERRLAALVGHVAGAIGVVRHRVAAPVVDVLMHRVMQATLEAWCRAVLFPPTVAQPLEPGFAYAIRQDLDCVKGAFSAEGAEAVGGKRAGLPLRVVEGLVDRLQRLVASSVALDAGKLADAYVAARDSTRRGAVAGEDEAKATRLDIEDPSDDEMRLLQLPAMRSHRALAASQSTQAAFALVLLRRGESEAKRFSASANLVDSAYRSFVDGGAK